MISTAILRGPFPPPELLGPQVDIQVLAAPFQPQRVLGDGPAVFDEGVLDRIVIPICAGIVGTFFINDGIRPGGWPSMLAVASAYPPHCLRARHSEQGGSAMIRGFFRGVLARGWPWGVLALVAGVAVWHAVDFPDEVDEEFPRVVRPTFSRRPPAGVSAGRARRHHRPGRAVRLGGGGRPGGDGAGSSPGDGRSGRALALGAGPGAGGVVARRDPGTGLRRLAWPGLARDGRSGRARRAALGPGRRSRGIGRPGGRSDRGGPAAPGRALAEWPGRRCRRPAPGGGRAGRAAAGGDPGGRAGRLLAALGVRPGRAGVRPGVWSDYRLSCSSPRRGGVV